MYLKKLISRINITFVLFAATILLGFFVITIQTGFTEVLPKDLENLAGSQNAEEIDSFPKIPAPEAPTAGYVDVYAEAINVYITNKSFPNVSGHYNSVKRFVQILHSD